ncbi:glycosyl hydrolase [Limisphaera ngatamarikiensis]|uniref:glycosyl hydrolase n=1 Tax=Limisphaera ngatamarikiensis TaxID=1324935 RepID=UPI0013EBC503|nr:glycosyl hydrolase [Limisphaera ngatamarikiensis]
MGTAVSRRGEQLDRTIEALRFLGLRWVRSGYESDVPVRNLLEVHRQTGVRFSYGLLSGGNDLKRLLDGAQRLAEAGALLALEGNNEPNNWPVRYQGRLGGGTSSWAPVAVLQRDLYRAVRSHPKLRDYPVWTVSEPGAQTDNAGLQFLEVPPGANTLLPPGTRFGDAANVHNYIYHPSAPHLTDNKCWQAADPSPDCPVDGLYKNFGRTWLKGFHGYSPKELETLPRVTTETGVTVHADVTEEVHGWHLLTMYLAQFKRGWQYTAVYLLRDRTDESGNQRFGFYRPDYSPRPAAWYLHRLTRLLQAPAPGRAGFRPEPLDYDLTPQPPTVHDLLLQRPDGAWVLILWNERVQGTDRVSVRLGRFAGKVQIHDPMADPTLLETHSSVRELGFDLDRHPRVLVITD